MQQQRQWGTLVSWGQIDRRHYIAVGILAAIIGIVGAIQGTADIGPFASIADVGGRHGSDQLAFFFPAAQHILDGQPFSIYDVRFLSYPNYNPPLSTILIAPLLAIGQAVMPGSASCVAAGYADVSCRSLLAFVAIGFIPFVLLMGYATVVALRRAYPTLPQTPTLLAFALVVLSPLTWQDFTIWWHFEQSMMLFFFIAGITQLQRRPLFAGVMLGLALLTRTTAAVPLATVLVMLVAQRAWPTLIRVVGASAIVVAVGFGPFFLFDYQNTAYSLLNWRGGAPIGNSIWSLFIHTPLDHLARRLDLVTALLAAVVIAWLAVRRLHISAFDRRAWGVITIAALLVPMISKTIWPYYALEPFVFLVIWEFSTLQDQAPGLWRWPALSIAFLSVAATLGQYIGLTTVNSLVLRLIGLLQFGVMLAFALVAWARLSAAGVEAPVTPGVAETDNRVGPAFANERSSIGRS